MIEISVKQNPIGKIPKGWEIVKLEEFIDIYDKERIPLSEMERANRKGVYPYCGANGVLDYIDDYIFEGEFILLAEDGGSYGKFEDSCYMMNGKFWVNNHAHIIKVKKNKSTNHFLLYMLNFLDLRSYVVGSTRVKLNQEYLKQIKVSYPSLPEQQKIAEILGTVDEAIEKVGQAIEKTGRLKKGLMQELLTKGIGHKEFKDSEIGKIPKEWDVLKLGSKISLEYGKGLTEGNRKIGEYPVFGSNGIIGYHNDFLINGPGIIVGRKGTIGAITWSNENFWPIDTTYYVRLIDKNVNLKWLFFKLSTLKLSKLNMATGTPGLNRELAYSKIILLPPLLEQQEIVEILSTVDKKIDMEKKRKEKLERIKKGLMQDLLTGKRRVKV